MDDKEVLLPAEGRVSIGRLPGNDLVVTGSEVSREHAFVLCEAGLYRILDNHSTAGTFVGGSKIEGAVPLKHGDEIRIGPAFLVFRDPPATAREQKDSAALNGRNLNPVFDAGSADMPDFGVPAEIYSDASMVLQKRIHARVMEKLNLREIADKHAEDDEIRRKMELALDAALQEVRHQLPPGVPLELLRRAMLDELVGYGPITPMLKDPTVKEVMVNGSGRIFVEQDGLKETHARFADDSHLLAIIRRIVEPLGRHVDGRSPKVDARLPEGHRVNAIIPPVALDGPALTIRKFPKVWTLQDSIKAQSLTKDMGEFLKEAVRAKQNIVVSGGTGSGKTTLLNVLSEFIPKSERVVTIEDSAELRLTHRNLVRLEARPPSTEDGGAVTIRDLVVNALRMRPDRIIVGECRHAEALDMLQAMSTGHDGSLTTVHANDPRGALTRLETMVLMAGFELPSRAIREQIVGAVHLIVQQSRFPDNSRKIEKISEVTGRLEGDVIQLQDIFIYKQTGFDTARKKVIGSFQATGNKPGFIKELHDKGDLKLDPNVFKPEI